MAPASDSRVLRPVVEPGDVLAGRYRLVEALREPGDGTSHGAAVWRAVDEVLARPILLTLLPAGPDGEAAARPFLEAAAMAGSLGRGARGTGVLAQVYDAALEQRPAERDGLAVGSVDVAYVVSEWVEGRTLAEVLREEGPLEPLLAADLAGRLAEALAEVHARGAVHGRLHPGNVLLPDAGGVKLAGTAVAAALHGRPPGVPGEASRAQQAADVRDLAACLYAMLTARWPATATPLPGGDLVPAPSAREDRPCTPGQVRAGVPRALDSVVMRALAPAHGRTPVRTADDLALELESAALAAHEPHSPVHRPSATHRSPWSRLSPRARKMLPLAATAVFLLAVGVTGYTAGRSLGTVQQDRSELETLVDNAPAAAPGAEGADAGERLDLTAASVHVTAFDPPPGDGRENSGAVPNTVDGDPSTGWDTERYDSERFGNLKSGVGLLVDLGEPVAVAQVQVGMRPGADLELRAADAPGATADDFRVVASASGTAAVTRLVPDSPVTARYFLLWYTRLPGEGSRFVGSIGELFFVRA